ncbi:AT-rich interactive domain-containing protein 4-like isoform X2 [Phalaenopsis equestris]|uniref:AT-rich interactive domain-containing protein 4-like isoform X2 n=1 Tax=Phalaenopsis equestris TaxID=78828 RepID=UPI0009E1AAA9|nr:AT-rich interactive domain-containing protein 4-like isoform X2 [Phalaenopsis equestris]
MLHSWVEPIKKCLLVVLCGNASGRERPVGGDGTRYPFPDIASSGFFEVRTLMNPTIDQFLDVQSATCPEILYFQGQQLEGEEEIGSLLWGTTDATNPDFFISLIIPPLPTIVYLEAPNSEKIAEALRLKGVPYVIFWKNSFTTYQACHFRLALFSVLKCGHAWDAFQFAHASFRLYCSKTKSILPSSCLQIERKFCPCFIGDAPKIHVNPHEKSTYDGESSASSLPNIKIHDEYVNVKFLVCGMPCILDACLLGSLEDGLSALLNIEIRGSKLHNKVSVSSHPCRAATSHGDYKMRCDIITCSSAFISLLVSGSLQTCVDDQLVENLIKYELIDKGQLIHAQSCCEENKFCSRPLSTDCIAAGASVFEVCMKIPRWAFQILKHLACEFSCRSLVTLGIASIHGIAVASFEKEDAERLLFFFSRNGKDLSKEDTNLSGLPISYSVTDIISSARPEIVIDGNWKDFNTLCSNVSKKQNQMTRGAYLQGLKVAAMRPIPHFRRQKNICFPVADTGKHLNLQEQAATSRTCKKLSSASLRYGIFSHGGHQSKSREHSTSSRKHNSAIPGSSVSKPASSMQISSTTKSASFFNEDSTSIHRLAYSIRRRSEAKSDLAKQRISSNPIPLKRHECDRCSIHDCSEEEFLKDLVKFLILRGHQRLVPPGGLSDFPGAVLNAKRLDLFCLYKEVVTRGGYYVGNGINWRGQVFSKMSNHSVNNKMTGITYALKRHYETYLLEYELAHNDVTINQCVLCQSTPGDWLSCARCSKWVHLGCDKRSLAAFKDYSKTDGLDYICPHCG